MDALIIAFVSGKGGTGKSTTSVLLGGALAEQGKKVLLIELDSGLRSVDIIAGVSNSTIFDIQDVLAGKCQPDDAVVSSDIYPGLSVISAPYQGGVISAKKLHELCQYFSKQYDYILVDAAAGLGPAYRIAVAISHRIVLVLTPDPVALRDGRLISDQLDEKNSGRVRLILNKVNAEQIFSAGILEDLDEAVDIVGARLLGVIPESPNILKASSSGTPLEKTSTEHRVYEAIAYRITGHDVPLVIQ